MLVIGIDPGISGSICFFQDGEIIDVVEMPTMTEGKKNKKQVNGSQIYNEILDKINKLSVDFNLDINDAKFYPLKRSLVYKSKEAYLGNIHFIIFGKKCLES